MVRLQVRTAAGEAAMTRYDVRFTPTFVLFDAAGALVARTSDVGEAAMQLRSLLARPGALRKSFE